MWLKKIWQFLLDERGEETPAAGGEGQVADPGDPGQGGDPGAGEGAGDPGQGTEPPVPPAFGEFGDTPKTLEESIALLQKVYQGYSGIKPEFDILKGKTSATERNLSLTRKALESAGIRATQREDGSIGLEVINQPKTEKKTRFNDDAIGKLAFHFQNDKTAAKSFVDLLMLAVQDQFDNEYEGRQKQTEEQTRRAQVLDKVYNQSVGLMFAYFPQLNGKWDADGKSTNQEFNKEFHDKVLDVVKEKYPRDPRGELLAALEVAQELGITAQVINKAKAEGFKQGAEQKRILGPAGSKTQGAAGGKGKKLSFEEFDKLSDEEKKKFSAEQVGAN